MDFTFLQQGSVSGSVQATDRLMKELKDVYKSDSLKRGIFYYNNITSVRLDITACPFHINHS